MLLECSIVPGASDVLLCQEPVCPLECPIVLRVNNVPL